MIFTFKLWEEFCEKLDKANVHSIPAKRLMHEHITPQYVVLKHDVETNVANALQMAGIEHKYGHCGVYYVQAYLLENSQNIAMLNEMQQMGHEISYHYDVMDSNAGDLPKAMQEFEEKIQLFEKHGFHIETLCQHGNPVVERKGYTSNRDFFRNRAVQAKYPALADIMVDFKQKAFGGTEYMYFSDAGRQFKLIYDPITNDLVPSDDKSISYDDLDQMWAYIMGQEDRCAIISTHPHRWVKSEVKYVVKTAIFKCVKNAAKMLMKVPVFKRIMSKYYYLAKKL